MSLIHYYDLIRKPIITEKTTNLSEFNKVTFEVSKSADKPSVKKAVEKIFDVVVSKVNILNVKGKKKRFKGKIGKCADVKKAIVTLAEGSAIDVTGVVK